MAKVLIVDDDPAVRRVLVRRLIAQGHTPTQAGGEREALSYLERELPDLVLMDTQMPESAPGYDICAWIKSSYQLPVVGMSGDLNYRSKWEQRGADAFLEKPIEWGDLDAAISKVVSGKR